MTVDELSNEFDVLVSSYTTEDSPMLEFDEYEKSMFLTQAQRDVIVGLYNGTLLGKGYEKDEEIRSYLHDLQVLRIYGINDDIMREGMGPIFYVLGYNSVSIYIPKEALFIVNEIVTSVDSENGICLTEDMLVGKDIPVVPVTKDELEKILHNPFRGPSKNRALRVSIGSAGLGGTYDSPEDTEYNGTVFEYISKVDIASVLITYIKNPSPIILTDITPNTIEGKSEKTEELLLKDVVYQMILKTAVQNAVNSRIKSKRQ